MSAQHYVDVELDSDGDVFHVRFVCAGGPENMCRQWCAEGCEEQCYGDPIRPWRPGQAEEELVAQAPAAGHRWEPMSSGTCRIVEWFDASGWNDTGWNEEDTEITADQLRPGRHLIEEEWTGDDYIWRYAAGPAAIVVVPESLTEAAPVEVIAKDPDAVGDPS